MFDRHDDVVSRLADACRVGDIAAIRAELDPAAVAVCDGGGLVPAPRTPTHGAQAVAELVTTLLCGDPRTEVTVARVNGRLGLLFAADSRPVAIVAVAVAVVSGASAVVVEAGPGSQAVGVGPGSAAAADGTDFDPRDGLVRRVSVCALWIVFNPVKLRGWY